MPQQAIAGPAGRRYSSYLLFVLFLVYIFNFVDRQILSILAEDIKRDLNIDDSQIGFLYGTVFAVFYAVFGLPLGKLADTWNRRSLISIGLGFWSIMTALSGTARSFTALAAYRIGVGVGEASATPAALSMLADSFPQRVRGLVMALYSSGIYVGAGIGIAIGGVVVENWNAAYPGGEGAIFGLRGWQVAYILVGVPGILMALWVWTLREPARGAIDGIIAPPSERPFAGAWADFLSLMPGISLWHMARAGGTSRDYVANLICFVVLLGLTVALILWLNSPAQWIALFSGLYVVFNWAQVTRLRDPVAFKLIFNTPSLILLVIGFACVAFVTYGLGFWGAPFFIRVHGMSEATVGQILGWSAAIGGLIGIVIGGFLSDFLRRITPRGRLYSGLISAGGALPFAILLLVLDDATWALVANFMFTVFSPMWIGTATSSVADLVLPRMRAVATALYIMVITFIGLALGPYSIGRISVALGEGPEALRSAGLGSLIMLVVALVLLIAACFFVARDESSLRDRARALGEPI